VQLAPVALEDAKRAQYEGYRDEAKNPASIMPTFASITLHSNDPAWAGVALSITAGKCVAEKRTEARITHRDGRVETISAEPDTFPSGYAQVLLSAMGGEHERFTSSCEVLASWHALDGLMQAWRTNGEGLTTYERGSSPLQ
jgi:glucose-6-phosphate 1-dehydrogenase